MLVGGVNDHRKKNEKEEARNEEYYNSYSYLFGDSSLATFENIRSTVNGNCTYESIIYHSKVCLKTCEYFIYIKLSV